MKKIFNILLCSLLFFSSVSSVAADTTFNNEETIIKNDLAKLQDDSYIYIDLSEIEIGETVEFTTTSVSESGEEIYSKLEIERVDVLPLLEIYDEDEYTTTLGVGQTYKFTKTWGTSYNSKVTLTLYLTKKSSTELEASNASISGRPAQGTQFTSKDFTLTQLYDWEVNGYGYYGMLSMADVININVYVDFDAAISIVSDVLAIRYSCYS